ncbi:MULTISPECIES: tripartite tricarboxylate transporter substrate-binding protein [unclassified Achromobacter]|uniref:tripartite tricarboxylate transporter substrate-binding protein n=1 Tax=unclassified Achromobacter TaxID=2626865 RepID=UPI0013039CA7|nr:MULTISPECIES: tripartite tricarboxylate transporter substrate-binding protein [unclassified Achromobacter]
MPSLRRMAAFVPLPRRLTGLLLSSGATGIGIALLAAPAQAAGYPEHAVTLVVPYAAGGPMDLVARQVSNTLAAQLGVAVIVENVPGAGSTIGTLRAIRAKADGYTLLLQHVGLATLPALYPKLGADLRRDLVPLGVVADVPMVIAVKASSSIAGPRELLARKTASALNWGTAGVGSASSLCLRQITEAAHAGATEVPYKGTGPALVDLLGGQIDAICDLYTNLKPMLDSGKLRALASLSEAGHSPVAGMQALGETVPSLQVFTAWYGLFAPRQTPDEAQVRLRAATASLVEDKAYRNALGVAGATIPSGEDASAQALATLLRRDMTRWSGLGATANAQ